MALIIHSECPGVSGRALASACGRPVSVAESRPVSAYLAVRCLGSIRPFVPSHVVLTCSEGDSLGCHPRQTGGNVLTRKAA